MENEFPHPRSELARGTGVSGVKEKVGKTTGYCLRTKRSFLYLR